MEDIVLFRGRYCQGVDAVDRIVDQWREQRPDFDASPMLVVGRILRVAQLMDTALRPPFAAAGLGQGDFDILAALRRAGPPYARTAGELRRELLVTSGAVTKQVDRLITRGLVRRDVGRQDARVRRVSLTDEGVTLVDELMAVHLANQRRLLAALPPDKAEDLAKALSELLDDLEDRPG
jgi:DNA-binding MarR family transcriptional regulator